MANILDILDSFEIEIDASALVPTVTVDDVFYLQDLKQRRIYLNGEITCEEVAPIIRHILQYNTIDRGIPVENRIPIRLLINSHGGDTVAEFSLINTMEISKTPIYTYSLGQTSSAALDIFLAGHKRYALKDTIAVLHKGNVSLSGTASQVENSSAWYKQMIKRFKEYVLEKTTLDSKTYNKRQDEDWYLTIEEMLKYHFIDGVIDDISLLIGD